MAKQPKGGNGGAQSKPAVTRHFNLCKQSAVFYLTEWLVKLAVHFNGTAGAAETKVIRQAAICSRFLVHPTSHRNKYHG